MANQKRRGGQTVVFDSPPSVKSTGALVGQKEAEGPLGAEFDMTEGDPMFGETTWEKAESRLVSRTIDIALKKSGLAATDINYIFAGDLLNQCTASTFGVRDTGIPFFGLFGACSTMAESLGLSAMIIDGGYAENVLAVAGSHFCSAEKQFRFPLEYGGQRPYSSQWTVTGAGAVILGSEDTGPFITHITTGRVEDKGIKDASNMGAAMSPAFISTLKAHFEDTGRTPQDYELILSGDLGLLGREISIELAKREGYDIKDNYDDCGVLIYDGKTQDTHAGGSGCGCSASILCAHVIPKLIDGTLSRVLFIATGALMSPTSTQQGGSIPSIAHAVVLDANAAAKA